MRIDLEWCPDFPVAELPLFAGFPYLVTRISPALYHLQLLPSDIGETGLIRLADFQLRFNRLELCLALATDRALYFARDGMRGFAPSPPRGGNLVTGKLQFCIGLTESAELAERRDSFAAWYGEYHGDREGFLYGDLTKGGRTATPLELAELAGMQECGVPVGLALCDRCGEWRGRCLDPNPEFAGMVMTVHCFCENDNYCARCHRLLYRNRLNANFYGNDGFVWHVPGFMAFGHRCPEE